MAVAKALSTISVFVEREGVARKEYLERILHSGEEGLAKTDYWSIPEDRRDAVIEKARARYTDLIDAVYRAGPEVGK